jgi:dephospho-CoA kinase
MSAKTSLKIGITGGIGSGKSLVTRIFSILGAPVYDADSRAKWLMENDSVLKKALIDLLGEEAYLENGRLNRALLASKIFSDPTLTQKVNALVHPSVKNDSQTWAEEHSHAPYLVKEAALMFESGNASQMDFMVMVYAPENLRVERVLMRDAHRSMDDIKAIIARQMKEEEKMKLADTVVKNDNKHLLLPQILNLHQRFTSGEDRLH